ncbi:MAG: PaaI family thioesterase [Xanthobacteraceae bacterium]
MLAAPSFTYGLPNPADVAGMTGRQMLQAMIEGKIPAPPIAQTLTFWLVEVGDGTCVFEGETGPHLLNPLGGVHGGWALTLIDTAAGCAGHTLLPAGVGYASVETKANFTRPIKHDTGRVRAEGRVVGRGRQIMSAEARILDADGRILAHGTSTLMVFGNAKSEGQTTARK